MAPQVPYSLRKFLKSRPTRFQPLGNASESSIPGVSLGEEVPYESEIMEQNRERYRGVEVTNPEQLERDGYEVAFTSHNVEIFEAREDLTQR
jgi:hypothetical protein